MEESKYFKKLSGDLCYLSPIREEDASRYTKWLNDLEISSNLQIAAKIISLSKEKEILAGIAKQNEVLAIVDAETDQLIGNCGLHNVNYIDGIADCGLFIGDKSYWNRGYGTEALTLLLDFAFNLMNLHNVKLDVYEFNHRAIRCYEKCGFKTIGRRRMARNIGGSRYDVIYMDILAEEFGSRSRIAKTIESGQSGRRN